MEGRLAKRRKSGKHSLCSVHNKKALKEMIKGAEADPEKERRRKQDGAPLGKELAAESPINGLNESVLQNQGGVSMMSKKIMGRKKRPSVHETELLVQQPLGVTACGDVEIALQTSQTHAESMGEEKRKKKKKKHVSVENSDVDQNLLEMGGLGLLAYAALVLEGNNEQGSTAQEGEKRKKKKKNDTNGNKDPVQKLLEGGRLEPLVSGKQEVRLPIAESHEKRDMTQIKVKRKKKLHYNPEDNELDQKPSEENTSEMLRDKRNIESILQTAENHAEVGVIQTITERKKERRTALESSYTDLKLFEEENPRSLVKRKLKASCQTVDSRGEESTLWKKIKVKKRSNTHENNKPDQNSLEENGMDMKWQQFKDKVDYSLQRSKDHEDVSAAEKDLMRRRKKKKVIMTKKWYNDPEFSGVHQHPMENNSLELPVKQHLAVENNHEEVSSTGKKREKMKRKGQDDHESNNLDQKMLEKIMQELLTKVTPVATQQTTESRVEVKEGQKKIKRKKRRPNVFGKSDLDYKLLEEGSLQLQVKRNLNSALRTTENHEGGMMKKKIKRKKKGFNAPGTNDSDRKKLEELNLRRQQVKLKLEASFPIAYNHSKGNASQKKIKRKKESRNVAESTYQVQNLLEEHRLEFPLRRDLEVTLQKVENHGEDSTMLKKVRKKIPGPSPPKKKLLEDCSLESPVQIKLGPSLQRTEKHTEVNTKLKNIKRKKRVNDQKLLESATLSSAQLTKNENVGKDQNPFSEIGETDSVSLAGTKTYQRKKKRLFSTLGKSLEPVKEGYPSSSLQVVRNSLMGDVVSHSDNSLASEKSKRKIKAKKVKGVVHTEVNPMQEKIKRKKRVNDKSCWSCNPPYSTKKKHSTS